MKAWIWFRKMGSTRWLPSNISYGSYGWKTRGWSETYFERDFNVKLIWHVYVYQKELYFIYLITSRSCWQHHLQPFQHFFVNAFALRSITQLLMIELKQPSWSGNGQATSIECTPTGGQRLTGSLRNTSPSKSTVAQVVWWSDLANMIGIALNREVWKV